MSNDMSIKLMGAGFVDEGLYLEILEKKYNALLDTVAKSIPICPICKKVMCPRNFSGYYESFSYWECNCTKFSKEDLRKYDGDECSGAYA